MSNIWTIFNNMGFGNYAFATNGAKTTMYNNERKLKIHIEK
jgi:hypothetical protein